MRKMICEKCGMEIEIEEGQEVFECSCGAKYEYQSLDQKTGKYRYGLAKKKSVSVGNAIQIIAKISFIGSCLAGLISAIVCWSISFGYAALVGAGFGALIGGVIFAVVGYFFIKGFGIIVTKCENDIKNCESELSESDDEDEEETLGNEEFSE